MKEQYYEELLASMQEKIDNHEYDSVIAALQEELAMPYVPLAFEQPYRRLLKLALAGKETETPVKRELMDVDEFAAKLFDPAIEQQLMAVEALKLVNLTYYADVLKQYLLKPLFEEVQCLLIYELIEQQYREELTTTKENLQITFIPYYMELPEETDGYQATISFLEHNIEKNPSLLQLSIKIAQILFMKKLPLSYEEDEIAFLGPSIIQYACEAIQDTHTWKQIRQKLAIDEEKLLKIEIE